ncbi:MAG TPA: ATP-binding protein [Longimicrobium sp.]|nr:ATP-binding protein [Longimicrobium sp.]
MRRVAAPRERAREALGWAAWIAALGALTAAMVAVRPHLDKAHVALAYLLLVLAASTRGSRARGIVLALVSFLCFNLFFLPPYHTFALRDPLDGLVLLSYLAVATAATQLLHRARAEAEEARRRADELNHLSTLGAETLNAGRAEDALHAFAAVIRSTLEADACEILLCEGDAPALRHAARDPADGRADAGVAPSATLAAERGAAVVERSGATLEIVSARDGDGGFPRVKDAVAVSLPLRVRDRIVGVLRVARASGLVLTAAQHRFFTVLAYYAALGAERVRLRAEAERAEALREADRLKDALLASVSHDLRTPLTTIKALAHQLAERGEEDAVVIEEEADRMNRFVADLLDLSRLDAGAVPLSPQITAAEDLLGAALQRVSGSMAEREIRASVPPGEPLLAGRFDFVQSLRVLVNLLENAHKYSPPGAPIEVDALREGDRLIFRVADQGPGVPEPQRERIFEPFHRQAGLPPDADGAGLGLSIARRLAEAQGGTLRYEPRPGGGSVFTFSLPAVDLSAELLP